jgi:hypothetical protein
VVLVVVVLVGLALELVELQLQDKVLQVVLVSLTKQLIAHSVVAAELELSVQMDQLQTLVPMEEMVLHLLSLAHQLQELAVELVGRLLAGLVVLAAEATVGTERLTLLQVQ